MTHPAMGIPNTTPLRFALMASAVVLANEAG